MVGKGFDIPYVGCLLYVTGWAIFVLGVVALIIWKQKLLAGRFGEGIIMEFG